MQAITRLAAAITLCAATFGSLSAQAEEARYTRWRCAPRSARKWPTT